MADKALTQDYKTLYDTLFNNNRDAIIFFNKTRIINANQAALNLFNTTREEFIGREIYEYTHDEETSRRRIEERLSGKSDFYTRQIQTPQGTRDIEVTSTPIDHPEITSYSTIRDVTERNKTQQKYQAIFERSADLIFVTNAHGIVFINPRGLEYLGYQHPDELIGKTTLTVIHQDSWEQASRYAAIRRSGGNPPSQYRVKLRRKDGTELDAEFNASYIEWDGVPSSITVARDISKQLKYDKKLEALHILASNLILEKTIEGIAEHTINAAYDILGYKHISFGVAEGKTLKLLLAKPQYTYPNIPIDGPGISTRAIRTGKPQLINDVTQDPEYLEVETDQERTLSELAFPIKNSGKPVAVLNIETPEVNAFTEDDVKLVTILVDHITAAIEKLNYQRQLEALHRHSNTLSVLKTREEVAEATVNIVKEVMGYSINSFGYVEKDRINFYNYEEGSVVTTLLLDGVGITVRTVKTGNTQLVNDTRNDPDYIFGRVAGSYDSLSELDIPIKLGNKVEAVINIESEELNQFTEEDQQLLEILVLHISSTLKNIDYREKTELIHQYTIKLDKVTDTEEALQITDQTLTEQLGYTTVDLLGVGKDSNEDTITTHHEHTVIPKRGTGIVGRALKTGQTQLVNDTTKDPDYTLGPYTAQNLSEIAVPVFKDEQISIILNIENTQRDAFTDEDKHLVEMIGMVLGQALSRIDRFKHLEETVDKRTRDLLDANQRLEKLSEMKTRFISTATHELRTPLTIMKGYLELTQDDIEMDTIKHYLDVVIRNTNRLETLVDDLLDQQRIEEGRLSLNKTSVDLSGLITELVNDMRSLVEAKHQKITLELPDTPIKVSGDEPRLTQVLVNLISNASKYSDSDTMINVKAEHSGAEVLVSITDQGYGINEEDMEKLFKPFPDIKRPIQTESSIGLGLAICKGIIELHGGRIWAESQGQDKGSTFMFTLPRL